MSLRAQLLSADDPSPVEVLRPNGLSDFFFAADHAGCLVPHALGDLGLPESERKRHIGWDIGIAGVAHHLSALLDASTVLQVYSRLVIDCNRGHDAESFIPSISENTTIAGISTSPASSGRLASAIFSCLTMPRSWALLDARAKAGRRTVLIALHSFTPSYKGVERKMHVAVFYRMPRFAHILRDLLRGEPYLIVAE